YAIETVFHSTLGYLLQLYLVHKASKRAHRHLIFDRHAGSALLLSQFFKVDCNLPALEWTFDHLGYNLAHRDIVDGLAVPFEFLAVKISANPENSANPKAVLDFDRDNVETHVLRELVSHVLGPCKICEYFADWSVNFYALLDNGHRGIVLVN